ncbi:MAG: TolB-like 6-bladed beta-propeller domain-containing protein, partial [Rickettsiales bacterium]|nr:TolB-like 6-bladed beta-propeller domain-containing protein [Rickettsiales bacterium]
MKKIQSILFFILLVCCTQNKTKFEDRVHFSYKDFGKPIELKGEILPLETLWKPMNIYCTDSVLVMIDIQHGDHFVQVYDKDNFNLLTKNVPKGIGPDENLSCWVLQINSDYIWAFDIQTRKIRAYSKDDILTKTDIKPYKTITFDERHMSIASLSNNTLVASSINDNQNLLNLYDYNGIRNNSIKVDFPLLNIENKANIKKKRLFENRILYSEKNNKIIVLYIYTDIIDIYDENLNLLSRIQGPDNFIPDLGMRGDFIHTKQNKTKFTYNQGYVTSTEFWVLYNGSSPDETGIKLPEKLFVFNFNGK